MTQQYDNSMRGVLFKNEDQRDDKNDPDYRGSAEVDRVQYWLDAWIRTSKGGKKFMSLSFKPKQAGQVKGGAQNPPDQKGGDFNDDIPF